MRDGDLVYFPDRERHALRAGGNGEFRFLQLNAPGTFETIWADDRNASTWADTGLDIEEAAGRSPNSRNVGPMPGGAPSGVDLTFATDPAARARRECQIHQQLMLASVPLILTFAKSPAEMRCEC